ncbi:MAG TPA: histone deacetylase [Thermomicrobiales bacterium]|nr:histone deacetylase [Thermomicrobiales bacterium]
MTSTALVYTPIYLGHDTGQHVEHAQRLITTMAHLDREGLLAARRIFEPEAVPFEALAAVHEPALIERVLQAAEAGGLWLDADTYVAPGSYEAAAYAAGGALIAVDAVLADDPKRVFVLSRPPGHHATPGQAMGFCLFNNAAVAARYALDRHGLERVAIVDWDVHHGNGTQEIFYESGQVFYASIHQWPLYPGTGRRDETGAGKGTGATLNLPLSPGAGDRTYLATFDGELAPRVRAFAPQLLLVSAGYDAHVEDPLAMMRVAEEGFAGLARRVKALAEECCAGRLVLVLEGGYNPEALARSVAATLRALDGSEK